MEKKFNLYDFLAYLIPGFLVLLVFCICLYEYFHRLDLQFVSEAQFLATAVLFVASYVVGHLLQVILRRVKGFLPIPRYSEYLLAETPDYALLSEAAKAAIKNKEFSQEFRGVIRKALESRFGSEFSGQANDLWWLARSYLVQHGATGHGELYNGMAALFGGLTAVFYLAAIAGILVVPAFHLDSSFSSFQQSHVVTSLCLGVVAALFTFITTKQYYHLNFLFAQEVYRGFYIKTKAEASQPETESQESKDS